MFQGPSSLFSRVAAPLAFPPTVPEGPLSPQSRQHLSRLVFSVTAIPAGEEEPTSCDLYFLLRGAESFFVSLLAICWLSLQKRLIRTLAHI